jgi:hypothetical protein
MAIGGISVEDPESPHVLHYEGEGGNKITVRGDEDNPLSVAEVGQFAVRFVVGLNPARTFNVGLDDGQIYGKLFSDDLSGWVTIERAGGMSTIEVNLSSS